MTDDLNAYCPPPCTICMLPLVEYLVATKKCGHIFHKVCYEQWRATKGSSACCPVCRTTAKDAVDLCFDFEPATTAQSQIASRLQRQVDQLETSLASLKGQYSQLQGEADERAFDLTEEVERQRTGLERARDELKRVKAERDDAQTKLRRNKLKLSLVSVEERPEDDEVFEALLRNLAQEPDRIEEVLWNLHKRCKDALGHMSAAKGEAKDLKARLEKAHVRIRLMRHEDPPARQKVEFGVQIQPEVPSRKRPRSDSASDIDVERENALPTPTMAARKGQIQTERYPHRLRETRRLF